MSARYSPKANLLAGGFLIGGVVLAVITSFVLADVSFTPMRDYVVQFSLMEGATGLAPEAAVRVGGQPEGKVRSVRVERDAATGEYVVNVKVRVRASLELYEDAWAFLEVPLLGNTSTINIPFVGTGAEVGTAQGESARLEAGETLRGSIAPPAFLSNAGFGPEQRGQFQRVFTSAERAMQQITEALDEIAPRVDPIVGDVEATAASARRSVEAAETDLAGWRESIDRTLDNADRFTTDLPLMADDAKVVLADAKEMIKSGRAVIDDNRPRIDNIIANADETMAAVNRDWVPAGTELIGSARRGAEEFSILVQRTDTILAERQPGIERTLANLRTASDQLKFLAIEARSQPWRLLHRPDTRELENQLLYDSARSYAMAVGDLRAASESLDALVARTSATGEIDVAALQAMRQKLQEAFQDYAQAEQDLLERMIHAER